MTLSTHLKHCAEMLERFGDGEVVLFGREGAEYTAAPRVSLIVTYDGVRKFFELSNGFAI